VKTLMKKIAEIPRLKPRAAGTHKGSVGKVCIIAGSVGMTGAAALAGRAALRAGAGLVRVATASGALPIVAALEPSYTTIGLAEDDAGRISARAVHSILNAVCENDASAVGPGLGLSGDLQSVIESLLKEKGLRLVIDGDGLNNLSRVKYWPDMVRAEVVLTPHPGEMRRLWSSLFRDKMSAGRGEQAMRLARESGCIVVLKGSGTVVTDGERLYVNTTGNPGMATAGSGDCLTGVVTALMGQGLSNFDAAVLGVYVHGLAGDIAAEKWGQVSLIATDIIEALGRAFIQCQ